MLGKKKTTYTDSSRLDNTQLKHHIRRAGAADAPYKAARQWCAHRLYSRHKKCLGCHKSGEEGFEDVDTPLSKYVK